MAPLAALLLLTLAGSAPPAGPHRLDEDLGGPPSRYAADMVRLLDAPRAAPDEGPERPLHLTCLPTPGQPRYVGARQAQTIRAPLTVVAGILDDIPHYPELFPDLVQVRVVDRAGDPDRYVTAWEQRVPVFFLPNTRYELTHLVDRSRPDQVIYRYRLLRSRDLTNSDGLVILEALGPALTRFTEYDFFDAHWGPLTAGMVWGASLKGIFLSAVAIQLRAEHPDWSYRQVAAAASQRLEREQATLETCRRDGDRG